MQENAVRPNAELGDFLRSRRARLAPDDAGVVSARRRRVQGLRREELARLAGMSVDYYTRLEQGRHGSASPNVLDAIAQALRLPAADREYLHRLAQPATVPTGSVSVRTETRRLMNALDPMPAVLTNSSMDVLASNTAARRLFHADFGAVPAGQRNGIRWMVTDPGARDLFGDEWANIAVDMIGLLRLRTGRNARRGSYQPLIDELMAASDLFRTVWGSQTVSLCDRRSKRFRHPQAGVIEFAVESLLVQHAEGQILEVFTPEPGSDSERTWRELMAGPM